MWWQAQATRPGFNPLCPRLSVRECLERRCSSAPGWSLGIILYRFMVQKIAWFFFPQSWDWSQSNIYVGQIFYHWAVTPALCFVRLNNSNVYVNVHLFSVTLSHFNVFGGVVLTNINQFWITGMLLLKYIYFNLLPDATSFGVEWLKMLFHFQSEEASY